MEEDIQRLDHFIRNIEGDRFRSDPEIVCLLKYLSAKANLVAAEIEFQMHDENRTPD